MNMDETYDAETLSIVNVSYGPLTKAGAEMKNEDGEVVGWETEIIPCFHCGKPAYWGGMYHSACLAHARLGDQP